MFHIGSLIQMLAKGGPVMIPLVLCSVVALAVVVERLGFWWRQGDVGPAERARAHRHFRDTSRYEWMFWDMGYRREAWPV